MAFNNLKEISVFGYADEFGTEKYNLGLSEKRAMAVAKALVEQGAEPTHYTDGKGRQGPREAFMEALRKKIEHSTGFNVPEDQHIPVALTFEEQTEVTRKARRVDVVVRKK